ncbi:PQQ-dependent sugar dehydrogenase [Roseococcus sp. SDR]|uniref:PQQ-dependent sugar dehydrogenase n=1 Tax=Roseococcus sp. SDR TaxID=2835532 RepID=UPI001BD0127E|nr:PQQ-dependent sugar dehydrogenase [Roseococcus sp. SDR]MBS7792782.1 PQQ-dependent sugar dehydrogenase [Roseococcus sp. SDR]MBV1848096.1 PQQ-dependent sugar dehydrogenase [Roseococcus sp. SDR]
MTLPRRPLFAALLAAPGIAHAQAETERSERGAFRWRVLAAGLENPWGGGFLPDGRLLLSERAGRARIMAPDGTLSPPLAGLPDVVAEGQGGLLDMQPAPDFATTSDVFFTSATLVEGGVLTRLSRARLTAQGFEAVRPVLDATPAQERGRLHYGGRLAFSPDGAHLFLTTGERNNSRERAQKLNDLAGKVIRLTRQGEIPRDNPFVGQAGLRGEIFTYGHRNPQGIAFNPATGSLFVAEFGPRGGDELNLIQPGRNFGWPDVSYGREYSGRQIAGGRTSGPGLTEPVRHWVPSVSPSGINFAPAHAQPLWRGALYIACLNTPGLLRLQMEGDSVVAEERLLWGRARMRQVLFAPDGGLLLLTDESRGRVLRLDAA